MDQEGLVFVGGDPLSLFLLMGKKNFQGIFSKVLGLRCDEPRVV